MSGQPSSGKPSAQLDRNFEVLYLSNTVSAEELGDKPLQAANSSSIMPFLFPSQSALNSVFSTPSTLVSRAPEPQPPKPTYKTRSERYSVWSALDDVKGKANTLSEEAQKEFTKASEAAQAKTGKMELYSAQYYAACALGGLLACVSLKVDIKDCNIHSLCSRVSHIRP